MIRRTEEDEVADVTLIDVSFVAESGVINATTCFPQTFVSTEFCIASRMEVIYELLFRRGTAFSLEGEYVGDGTGRKI